MARASTGPGSTVLDVCTGAAGVALELARQGAEVVGLDVSSEMLSEARRSVHEDQAGERVTLVRGRAESLPFSTASFDNVIFTFLLRYVEDPAATIAELSRMVKPGGRMASLEFFVPSSPAVRVPWLAYTRAVLPIAGLAASLAWGRVGRFLGPSISGLYRRYPLASQVEMWRSVGLNDVAWDTLSLGGAIIIWGTKSE